MNRRALRHVAHVDLCRNVTVFRGFFARGAVFRAGVFIVCLFWLGCPECGFDTLYRVCEFVSKTGCPVSANIITLEPHCYNSMNGCIARRGKVSWVRGPLPSPLSFVRL